MQAQDANGGAAAASTLFNAGGGGRGCREIGGPSGQKPVAQNSSSGVEITCRELARFESGGALGSVGGASAGNAPELSRDSYGGERDKEGREGV